MVRRRSIWGRDSERLRNVFEWTSRPGDAELVLPSEAETSTLTIWFLMIVSPSGGSVITCFDPLLPDQNYPQLSRQSRRDPTVKLEGRGTAAIRWNSKSKFFSDWKLVAEVVSVKTPAASTQQVPLFSAVGFTAPNEMRLVFALILIWWTIQLNQIKNLLCTVLSFSLQKSE